MTELEVKKFFDGVELSFSSYYKYTFTYIGIKDGIEVVVEYGGDSDDIYHLEMYPTEYFSKNDTFSSFDFDGEKYFFFD